MADVEKAASGDIEARLPSAPAPSDSAGPLAAAGQLPRQESAVQSPAEVGRRGKWSIRAHLAEVVTSSPDACTSPPPTDGSSGTPAAPSPPPSSSSPLLLEIELLFLSFATGIQDATTFPDYACFASNQTGNTVLFAVGAAGLARGSFELTNVSISLGVFVAGCVVAGQVPNALGAARRRWWLLLTNAVSTALVFAAVAVQWVEIARGPSGGGSGGGAEQQQQGGRLERTGPAAMGVVALLALSSAAQVSMARPLNVPQITTAMATAAWVDLLVDPSLGRRRNRARDRRALFIGALAVGSFVGAFAQARVNSPFALLLSAVLKLVVTAMFWFNGGEVEE